MSAALGVMRVERMGKETNAAFRVVPAREN